MKSLSAIDWVALVLVLVGGLNWGLIGALDLNLVAALFGEDSVLSRIVYVLVGLATIYVAILLPKLGRR